MRKVAASAALVVSGFLVGTPAFAISIPEQSAWLQITPCDWTCLATATFDGETGIGLDEVLDTTPDVMYQIAGEVAEIDPINSTAYFSAGGDLFKYDLTTLGVASFLGNKSTILPADETYIRGLAMDNSTGALYISWWNSDASHYYLSEFDPGTNSLVGDNLQLDDYLLSSDSYDVAISNGNLYVLNNDDEMVVIDLSTGWVSDVISYPVNSYNPNAIGTDVDGNLRVALYNEDDSNDVHIFVYDVNSGEWSDAIDLNTNVYALAWWDRDLAAPADTSGGSLASTGVDVSGIALGCVMLVAVGVVAAVRRRVRR